MMSTLLAGLKNVQCYLDDVVIWGSSQEEHDQCLSAVLSKLSVHGVKLNLEKCEFAKDKIQYLGHTISEKGIQVGDKHKAITEEYFERKRDFENV